MISENASFVVWALRESRSVAGEEALPLLLALAADHVDAGLSPMAVRNARELPDMMSTKYLDF